MKPLVLLAALSLGACGGPEDPPQRDSQTGRRTSAVTTRITATQIRTQDRSRDQQRYEDRAARSHPLLDRLPLTVGAVRVSIAGLDRSGRVLLVINAGRQGNDHARAVYRDLLSAFGDQGHAYRVQLKR